MVEGLAMIPGLYTYAATAIVAGALAFGAGWQTQEWRYGKQIAGIQAQHATAALKLSEAARADETKTALKESTHAANTSKNSDEFTASQPVRDAISRTDLARVDRLRTDAERRAATYRAQAQADDAARRDLGNRLETFDRQLVEGIAVVGELRKDLIRRDAEIVLVIGQLAADRELIGQEKGPEQLP